VIEELTDKLKHSTKFLSKEIVRNLRDKEVDDKEV